MQPGRRNRWNMMRIDDPYKPEPPPPAAGPVPIAGRSPGDRARPVRPELLQSANDLIMPAPRLQAAGPAGHRHAGHFHIFLSCFSRPYGDASDGLRFGTGFAKTGMRLRSACADRPPVF